MQAKKTYKVEYDDNEFHFMGEQLFEAADDIMAVKKARQIARKYFGKVIAVYTIERNNWKPITATKKAIYSNPTKSTI